ncbi:MAG TPA: dTMP kinase [Steroidobacteraceae bacterium]|jgi:dTMP kinase|nr:dTMP kinase [Steroidobacteraceae bacterium]
MLISLEGIEGAGKSTLAIALAGALSERGLSVRLTREPGGTPLAERLRGVVLERGSEHIGAEAETLLMFAARSIHLDNLVRPALRAGSWVICDRFTDATRAYQGAGRGVDPTLIEHLAAAVHADLWPQRTLLLDLPVADGIARARSRRGSGDRFEDEQRDFFERVRGGYLRIAAAEPQRVRVLDALEAPAALTQRALAALSDLLPAAPPGRAGAE